MSNEELVQLYQTGDKIAIEELVINNSGIVYKIANKYNGVNREMTIDDLIQEGTIGLIEAAKRYDFNNEKKAKFITYAIYYIDRYINLCVNGRSSKDVGNNKFYSDCTSLNSSIGKESEDERINFIECIDYGIENVEEKLYIEKLREDLEKVMIENNTLQEREVLKFHYGWDCKSCTLEYIGDMLGISRERVRQIESKALRKIRTTKWVRVEAEQYYDLSSTYTNSEKKIDFMDKYFGGRYDKT